MSYTKKSSSFQSFSGYKKVKKSYPWSETGTVIGGRNIRCWWHHLTNEVSWCNYEPAPLIRFEYESVAEIANIKPLPMRTKATVTENEPAKIKLK